MESRCDQNIQMLDSVADQASILATLTTRYAVEGLDHVLLAQIRPLLILYRTSGWKHQNSRR
jgi:hypothetical protein